MTRGAATSLPCLKGPAAWNRILPDPPASEVLTDDIRADITIIGAGFAGLSAARRLTQIDSGLKIVVLDALPLADSSAGRNSGFMIDLPHELTSQDYAGAGDDTALIALNRKAIGFAGTRLRTTRSMRTISTRPARSTARRVPRPRRITAAMLRICKAWVKITSCSTANR